jgi:hypothetical protein
LRLSLAIGGALCLLGLSACGSSGPLVVSEEPLAWVRTDGQSGRANPALIDQFAADRAACGIATTADNSALRGAEPCMSKRGYVLVPASQAEATAAKFRASVAARFPAGKS